MKQYDFLVAYIFKRNGMSGYGRTFMSSDGKGITVEKIEDFERIIKENNNFDGVGILSCQLLDRSNK